MLLSYLAWWLEMRLLMMGRRKAAVFPDPVCAQAIRSLPAITVGREYLCTGVKEV